MKKNRSLGTDRELHFNGVKGITLIALIVTNIVPYDKKLKCCNL